LSKVLGAVLAGGRSSRFGTDKALAQWEGRSLLDHAVTLLEGVCTRVVVCGRPSEGERMIADRPEAGLGPLGGLNAALHLARELGLASVVSIGCDTPIIPATVLNTLVRSQRPLILESQPIIGSWPASLAEALDRFLAKHPTRSVRAWAETCGAEMFSFEGIPNVNYADDLEALNFQDIPASECPKGSGDPL
jgi:molybdopterin-guanine dinucleotide biosynthesis protein A